MTSALNHNFAQNYPQLMNQALGSGYSEAQLRLLRDAFELALAFSDGMYRMQGVPLLNHLVTNASILLTDGQRSDMVVAGLLHASYVLHRFHDSSRSADLDTRRAFLRERIGEEIEVLVWTFGRLPWYSESAIGSHLKRWHDVSPLERDVLILRLANELDDYLDNAANYTPVGRHDYRSEACLNLCIELAAKLEVPVIQRELERIQRSVDAPPGYLVRQQDKGYQLTNRIWERTWSERLRRRGGELKRLLSGRGGRR